MADGAGEKLSQQPPATTGTEDDFYYIVQVAQTRKQTRTQLRAAIASGWSSVVQALIGAADAAAARLAIGITLTLTNFDVTPGRVLKVADFGWGGVAPGLPVNDMNTLTASSTLTLNASTLNRPSAGDGIGVGLHVERSGNASAAQIVMERAGAIYYRSRSGDSSSGTWSAWVRFDRGIRTSSAGRETVKYPDGLMIQTGTEATFAVAATSNTGRNITFPEPFINADYSFSIMGNPSASVDVYGFTQYSNKIAASITTTYRNGATAQNVQGTSWQAIGRWF